VGISVFDDSRLREGLDVNGKLWVGTKVNSGVCSRNILVTKSQSFNGRLWVGTKVNSGGIVIEGTSGRISVGVGAVRRISAFVDFGSIAVQSLHDALQTSAIVVPSIPITVVHLE